MAHLPSRKAAAILGLHPNTLRSYANKGRVALLCQLLLVQITGGLPGK